VSLGAFEVLKDVFGASGIEDVLDNSGISGVRLTAGAL